jgi:PKD repeat protein
MVRHDDFTPHGNISAPTGPCPYAMVFGGSPVASGAIGFDHEAEPHDVGWQIECVSGDCPTSLYCVEDWACPVGMGLGPVHGPRCEVPLRVCKTDADGNPIEGWQFTIDSVDYTTGDDGCVTVMVEPGTHEVCEQLPQTVAGKTYVDICGVTIDGAAVVPVENPVGSGNWCVTLTTGCEPNEAHVVIWCNRENLPPTCHITWDPDPGIVNEPVHFDANASDPDGDPVSCVWDFGCGCPPASGCVTSHTYGAPQVYDVQVTVTDDYGAVTICTAPVPVIEPEPCKVICDGTACGGGGGGGATPSRYYYTLIAPTGKVLDHFHIGVHDCDLDNYSNFVLPPGWSVTGIFTGINPLDDDLTPHGNISAPTGECPCALVFGGPPITSGVIGYDHAGPPHDVGWQLELTVSPTWICTEDWAMPVGMGQGPAHSPRVADQPPVCDITWEPPGPYAGDPVQFHANAVDPDGGPVTCEWDFGDGTPPQPGCDPVHQFPTPGVYTVCVKVTDDEGNEVQCCEQITIGPGEELCLPLAGECWHMITLPCYPINPDPWEVFDELRPPNKPLDLLSGSLHRYDHAGLQYVTYWKSSPSAFGPIKPGDGYWLSLHYDEVICYEAWCSGQSEQLSFPTPGWYLIGSPQPGDIYIDDTRWSQGPLGPYPFSMIMDLWVQDPFVGYSCELGRYTYMGLKPTDEDDHLRVFQGYWMYAFEGDLTMVVPPPP